MGLLELAAADFFIRAGMDNGFFCFLHLFVHWVVKAGFPNRLLFAARRSQWPGLRP